MTEDLIKQEAEDVRVLLATPEGARFFCRLLDFCGVDRVTYEPGDSHHSAFKEGMRNVGLMLQSEIREAAGGELAVMRAREQRARIYEMEGDER